MTDPLAAVPIPVNEEEQDALIPIPVGYHLLVAMPQVAETFGSGLLKANQTIHHESILSMIGLVLDMGAEAYEDKEKFPSGPWCEVGDYILMRMNSGTRFKVGTQEYRLINDDSVEAVVEDPSGIQRV